MKTALSLTALFVSFSLFAQRPTISVTPGSEIINKIQRTGLKTYVSFDDNKTGNAWADYLRKNNKGKGRVESSKNTYTMETITIPSISEKPIRMMSVVQQDEKDKSFVFAAFDLGSGYINSADSHYATAEKFMRDFALKMYRDEYGNQLDDAEKAFLAAQKAQQKLADKEQSMQKDIQNSNQDILDMQKKIEDKKQKIADLTKQIEDNKIAKQKAADETDKTKKAFEQMKSKLGDIN